MRNLTGAIMLVAMLAACGGGGNEQPEQAFIPDFSSPAGATEAFQRAVETLNITLVEQVMVAEDRAEFMPQFRHNFSESTKQNVTWELEFKHAAYATEDIAQCQATYYQVRGDNRTEFVKVWLEFVQVEEGVWKYSPSRSKYLTALMRGELKPEEDPKEPETDPEKEPEQPPEGEDSTDPQDQPGDND